MDGIPDSYTTREILVNFQSAGNESSGRYRQHGLDQASQPAVVRLFQFPETQDPAHARGADRAGSLSSAVERIRAAILLSRPGTRAQAGLAAAGLAQSVGGAARVRQFSGDALAIRRGRDPGNVPGRRFRTGRTRGRSAPDHILRFRTDPAAAGIHESGGRVGKDRGKSPAWCTRQFPMASAGWRPTKCTRAEFTICWSTIRNYGAADFAEDPEAWGLKLIGRSGEAGCTGPSGDAAISGHRRRPIQHHGADRGRDRPRAGNRTSGTLAITRRRAKAGGNSSRR